MPAPTPVPDQVLLTTEEYNGLREGLANLVPEYKLRTQVIRTIISSVNKWRFGSAAGEVRRSPLGSIAVRVQDDDTGQLGWDVPRLEDGDEPTLEAIADWPIVHQESWYERSVDGDYGTER